MEPLNYSFPFVRDVHVKINILINQNGGIATLRQDYYFKSSLMVNIYDHKIKTIKYKTKD